MDHFPAMLSRRQLLASAAAGVGSLVLLSCGSSESAAPAPGSATEGLTPDCVLTPTGQEGPFYTDTRLARVDITDGKSGQRLDLRFQVIDAATCAAIPGAIVDVWHADAGGLYSAFPEQGDDQDIDTSSERFLRGFHTTDADGVASFKTIYPGWYPGRTTHIHVKVLFSDATLVTTQAFFPDDVTSAVYRDHDAYVERGDKDTSNDDDGLGATDNALQLAVTEAADHLVANFTIGVNR